MINYISSPFKWFFKLEAASGLILLISAILALLISNSSFSDYYFNSSPLFILIGLSLGLIIGFYELAKSVFKK